MIVAIGTDDTLASPGAQLDYYQSVIDRMGQSRVDTFARFFVIPQVGHGLRGNSYVTNGQGRTMPPSPIPSTFDRAGILLDWVEKGKAPDVIVAKKIVQGQVTRSRPLCPYPQVARYTGNGSIDAAENFTCIMVQETRLQQKKELKAPTLP